MNARFDLLARAAAGGLSWRQALRELVPRLRSPGAEPDPAFDHLARSLAEELPRREAIRRLGVGLTTALLASVGLRRAWSQSASDCQGFCRSRIDPQHSQGAFGACVSSCEDCVQQGGELCGTSIGGSVVCCAGSLTCCGTGCCGPEEGCIAGSCCPATRTCGTICCRPGEGCIAGSCCPFIKTCGTNCCGALQVCQAGRCCLPPRSPCTEGSACCSGICGHDGCAF